MKKCSLDDEEVVLLGPPTGDGGYHAMEHGSDHECAPAVVRPVQDGKPFDGELVRLVPRENGVGYRKEVLYSRDGPPMANSREYVDGWDRIFGKRAGVGQA